MSTTDLATRTNGAETFSESQIDLIKRTVAKGSSDEELSLFLYTAASRGLDPLLRQIHAVMRWDKKAGRNVMAIQVGIDGYRLLADRTGLYAGNDDAVFNGITVEGEGQATWEHPESATVTVWKLVAGQRCPFTATAYWSDFYPGGEGGFMWRKMPRVMLAKVSEAAALRKGFPAQLGGMYIPEEMQQAGPALELETRPELSDKPEVAGKNQPPASDATWNRWNAAVEVAREREVTYSAPPSHITETALIRWCQKLEHKIADAAEGQAHDLAASQDDGTFAPTAEIPF